MNRSGGRTNAHGARRELRHRRRRPRFGRFLARTTVGTLIPGVGLIAAGRRRLGAAILTLFIVTVLAALMVAVIVPNRRLISYGGDRQMLMVVGVGLAAVAVIWLIIALVTHRLLEPPGLPPGKRLGGALVVILVTSLIVAPLSLGARNALVQRDLIGAISGGDSLTTPDIADARDPWADIPRLNILLLGSDAGPGREGERLNSMIVASIDTETGDTTMIGIPRNLRRLPFAPHSPLAELYPYGFDGEGDEREWMAMSIYSNAPALHPDVFEGTENPGADATKWAIEGALDINVDYFIFVNMEGFQVLVDALGGVTVNVPRDIPIGNKNREDGLGCTTPRGYIRAGDNQKLNGGEALWFARSRCMSTDYDRMARQQCLLGALANQANPTTLFTQYQSIASAAKEIVKTDLPEDLFPAFIDLAFEVRNGTMESLTLDREFFQATTGTTPGSPDYVQLQAHIAGILDGEDGDDSRGSEDAEAGDHPAAEDETEPDDGAGTDDTITDDVPQADPDAPEDTDGSTEAGDGDLDTYGDVEDDDGVVVDPDQPVETDAVC
jgi:polyisoprenyl-teichoic acid--peptidoglycan teichoic acid transferase